MTIGKPLTQFAAFTVAMPAAVALSLWVLFVPLRVDLVSGGREQSIVEQANQIQRALLKKGYWVGDAGADGNFTDETLAALLAFQDNNALPVQPRCDRQCRSKLGLPSGADIDVLMAGGLILGSPSPASSPSTR